MIGFYPNMISATSDTYTQDEMCGGDAKTFGWRDPGILQVPKSQFSFLTFEERSYFQFDCWTTIFLHLWRSYVWIQ